VNQVMATAVPTAPAKIAPCPTVAAAVVIGRPLPTRAVVRLSQTATLLQPVYMPRVPQSKTWASGLQARIAARSSWAYLSERSSPASMIRKTTKVDQTGSSSAATSQTEKPMQVTRSGRVKRFRRARLGRWSGSAQIA
jgi:hypothetical protein